ncbi:hypothetical protein GCWU000325_02233 [Alloprevotella tannerae ATCC 51259]|uniref:Uncharacterized protein n=1 Tax=Alloprevotella tannerae ATCC 51259 TaxID=626522 RepID=C9LJ21_9BACT|nr:hypothetical protein GCWU000325_02233 [Alloprevotella tannerae ATCC 51259]
MSRFMSSFALSKGNQNRSNEGPAGNSCDAINELLTSNQFH